MSVFVQYGFTSVDDRSADVTYTGTWHDDASSSFSEGTARYTNEVGATVEFSFAGTAIRWYGQEDTNFGTADVYIDDTMPVGLCDRYWTLKNVERKEKI